MPGVVVVRARAGLLALVLALTAVALAGGERAGALPAPAYRTSADAVCAHANARLDALPAPRSSAGVRAWIARAVPIYSRAVARLRGLTPPRRLAARHARWTATLARRARLARGLRARIQAGAPPVAALEAARPRLERLRLRARSRARALRLTACAGDPRPAR